MKFHLVQGKDEDWGLKLASGTDWETEEPEDSWQGESLQYMKYRYVEKTAVLLFSTLKKWEPIALPLRPPYWGSTSVPYKNCLPCS